MQYQVLTKMSIINFINRVCVQDAVYWGTPVNDGYGGYTFADPIEIKVRWEEKVRTVLDPFGEYKMSKAAIIVKQDLDYNGYMYLGTLVELQADTEITIANPKTVPMAFPIIAYDKIPLFRSTTKFVYTVYLGFRNN
jgi:hypothetical protein